MINVLKLEMQHTMQHIKYFKFHLLFIFGLYYASAYSQISNIAVSPGATVFHNRLPEIGCANVYVGTSCATVVSSVNPLPTDDQKDLSMQRVLTLGIDPSISYAGGGYNCKVTLTINRYSKTNQSLAPIKDSLYVIYNPFSGRNNYQDQAVHYVRDSAYTVSVSVTAISINGVASDSLPKNMFLDNEISLVRYYSFLGTAISTGNIVATPIDLDCDGINDELQISWQPLQGADSYDLEWTFVNDYADDSVSGNYLPQTSLGYDFRYNSTRINTQGSSYINNSMYNITLAFEHGYLLYRVRALGEDKSHPDTLVVGAWSIAADSGNVASANPSVFQVTTEHEKNKNWQYNASFAENGKKKEVIGYFDGSLRGRETVTKMNSDHNVLVGQTIYDSQGRKAITVLPTPVALPSCSNGLNGNEPAIHYYSRYNVDANDSAYSRVDFDFDAQGGDSCNSTTAGMSTVSGASKYYSSNNAIKSGYNAYLPDAAQFPFAQTEYTPDNTGRIRRQGGVGKNFQIGTGHETQYIYGTPNQVVLDRLFGVEVGEASHYKENIVVDANGQASISYLNQEGKVVATSLAGNPSTDLTGKPILSLLNSKDSAQSLLNIDLLNKDTSGISASNVINQDNNAIVFATQLPVAYGSNYAFSYSLSVSPLTLKTCTAPICMSCVYSLNIQVLDDCGKLVSSTGVNSDSINPINSYVGHFSMVNDSMVFSASSSANSSNVTAQKAFSLYLNPGNYTVNKILTLNNDAVDFYVQQALDSANASSCTRNYQNILNSYLAQIDTNSCKINCGTCASSLGNRDEWISSGKGTALQYDLLMDQCMQPCKTVSLCDATYQLLLGDVSPSGQYGNDSLNINGLVTDPLSVFNASNSLPIANANWRNPETYVNGTFYPYYIGSDNTPSKIYLSVLDPVNMVFSPPVLNNTVSQGVYFDSTVQRYYTMPNNLTNVQDFLNNWDQNWAKALVIYHPEYSYYKLCTLYSNVQTGDSLSSDGFDALLNKANTATQAVSLGLLPEGYGNIADTNKRVTNFFTSSSGKIYDPFAANPVFSSLVKNYNVDSLLYNSYKRYTGGSVAVGTSFGYSMPEAAAMLTRCSNFYGLNPSPSCIDFGGPTSNTAMTDSVHNQEWLTFRGLYLSVKGALQKSLLNKYVLSLVDSGGSNVCIGATNIDLYQTGLLNSTGPSSPYYQKCQPCSQQTIGLYVNKIKRFLDASNIPNSNADSANNASFDQTGQCPITTELQGLLSNLAQRQQLLSSNISLSQNPCFTPALYTAFTSDPVPDPNWVDCQYSGTLSGNDLLITITSGSGSNTVTYSTMKLLYPFNGQPGAASDNWNSIVKFNQLYYVSKGTGKLPYSFSVLAAQANNAGTANPYLYTLVNGLSSDQNLFTCNLNTRSCTPSALSYAVRDLLTGIAVNGGLDQSLNLSMLSSKYYSGYGTSAILSNFPGQDPNKLTLIHKAGSDFWDLADGSYHLTIYFTYLPKSGSASGLSNIAGLSNIRCDGTTGTLLSALTKTGDTIGNLAVNFSNYSIASPGDTIENVAAIPSTTTSLITPVVCRGSSFANNKSLSAVVSEMFVNNAYGARFVKDLMNTSGYDNRLKGYAPKNCSGMELEYLNATKTQLVYHFKVPCGKHHDEPFTNLDSAVVGAGAPWDIRLVQRVNGYFDIPDFYTSKSFVNYEYGDSIATLYYGQSAAAITYSNSCENERETHKRNKKSCIDSTYCPIYFNLPYSIDNVTVIAVGSIYGVGNRDANNDYSNFEFLLTSLDEDTGDTITGLVHGSSCIPIQNCTCSDPYAQFENTYQRSIFDLYDYTFTIPSIGYAQSNLPCGQVPDTIAPSPALPLANIKNPCITQQFNNAYALAQNAYDQYLDSVKTILASAYISHCLAAKENFNVRYKDKQFHYTLYYYDQAGNLVRTVPPEGVSLIPNDTSSNAAVEQSLNNQRTSAVQDTFTNHTLSTTYDYNSLNQLVKQSVPDHDKINIWQYSTPTGLVPNLVTTEVQFVSPNSGYLVGYLPQSDGSNRGYVYASNDGGQTWNQVHNLVNADLNKVFMIDSANGYAIGKMGVMLSTEDGGSSWDLVPTYPYGLKSELKDLYFTSPTHGILIGAGNPIVYNYSSTSTNNPFTISTGCQNTDTLTGIAYNSVLNTFYVCGHNAQGMGVIYESNNGGLNWNKVKSYRSEDLTKVQFLSGKSHLHGFACGADGTLLWTIDGGLNWLSQKSNISAVLRDMFFVNDYVGVALIDSAVGYSKLYMTSNAGLQWTSLGTNGKYYNALSFYIDSITVSAGKPAYKGVAVGKGGAVSRILATSGGVSPYFGVVDLNSPNVNSELSCVSTKLNSTSKKLYILIGGKADKNLYSTLDGAASVVSWTGTSTAQSGYSKVGMNITTAGNIRGVLIDNNGLGYTISQSSSNISPSGTVSPVINHTISISVLYNGGSPFSNSNFIDLSSYHDSTYFILSSGSTSSSTIYVVKYPGAVNSSCSNGSCCAALSGTMPGIVSSIYLNDTLSGILTGVGASGTIFQSGNGISSLGSVNWHDQSLNARVQPLNGISFATDYPSGQDSLFVAVGNNGTVISSGTGTNWVQQKTGTKVNFNAIALKTYNTGVIVGDNATMSKLSSVSSGSPTSLSFAPVNLTQVLNLSQAASFNDVLFDQSGNIYACGSSGTVVFQPNSYSYAVSLLKPNQTTFTGLCMIPGLSTVLSVGTGNAIYQYVGGGGAQVLDIYPDKLNAVNFSDLNTGAIVGDFGFARTTADAGNSWGIVYPNLTTGCSGISLVPNYNTVWSISAGNALVAGSGTYLGHIYGNNIVDISAYSCASGAMTWNAIRFNSQYPNKGYIVGTARSVGSLMLDNNGALTLNFNIPVLNTAASATELNALHIFRDNTFMVVGNNNTISYFNGTNWVNEASSTGSSANVYNDVYFHDDRSGYVVGDNGVILRSIGTVNIQDMGSTALTWDASKPYMETTTPVQAANINVVAFADRYNGLLGGDFSVAGSANPYVRLLHDESGLFSSYFWYDRLGRLAISQNAKQFAKVPTAYSYTLYDALGRITEVGEKAENANGTIFSGIFGTIVNGAYNPVVMNDSIEQLWISGPGSRTEVTHTYYDTVQFSTLPIAQQNLRKRVSSTTYEDVYDGNPNSYDFGTHYSYDIHGNVSTLLQQNNKVDIVSQRFKRLDYDYDLVSGKVNQVSYQSGQPDRFYHRYLYDADNRITNVETSKDSVIWDNDASYEYYAHGPLARVELGNNKVQGIDYAYTLQGWIKGVNSNVLKPNTDIGQDGLVGNVNANFAADAFGYSLNYYTGDYHPIGSIGSKDSAFASLISGNTLSDVLSSRHDLFNGNISSMVTTLMDTVTYSQTIGTPKILPQATSYQYDQLNRLVEAQAYQNIDTTLNKWLSGSTYAGLYNNKFVYDANGNILSQQRKDSSGTLIDNLVYHYAQQAGHTVANRLYHVNDSVSVTRSTSDMEDQGLFTSNLTQINSKNNYSYDPIGNLVKDSLEQIASIQWSVYGKIKGVNRTTGSAKKNILFDYDPSGNRVAKRVLDNNNHLLYVDYYSRDAQGNIMAIYKRRNLGDSLAGFMLKERNIYGSSMIATNYDTTEMIGARVDTAHAYHHLGNKNFYLENHLGNVLATISDKKIPRFSSGVLTGYQPDIISSTDFGPFGYELEGRNFNSKATRYGFNGKMKDNEVEGEGDAYDFGARIYDPRLGRWFLPDLLFAKRPFESPYNFVGNSPLLNQEIDGKDYGVYVNNETHTIIVRATYYTKQGDDASHNSAVNATQFWNEQSGKYQYIVKQGDKEIKYDIKFELDVKDAEQPNTELLADRIPTNDFTKCTPSAESNTYTVEQDNSEVFKSDKAEINVGGLTENGHSIYVKDTYKNVAVGSHEEGHTVGINHSGNGVMTPNLNDNEHSEKTNVYNIQAIIDNALNPSKGYETNPSAKGNVHQNGQVPQNFDKGKVIKTEK